MNSYRKNTIVAGSLFIIAIITSLLGGGLIESILVAPGYLSNLTTNTNTLFIGIFLEFINAFAVIGIAVTLFPTLRKHNESMANGYVSFRIIEAIFCIVSALIPLVLISLSQAYLKEDSLARTLGMLLISFRASLAQIVIPISFGFGALLFYHVLFYSRLVPRFISIWGLIGVILVLVLVFIKASTTVNLILVLPIILNEMFLGAWLIIKGFNPFVGSGWAA